MNTNRMPAIATIAKTGSRFCSILSEPVLVACPECGQPCHRVFSSFASIKSTRDMLSTKNLAKHGFTQYKKAGGGSYEKTCGDGPNVISRD